MNKSIARCPECDKVISLRFPLHDCKPMNYKPKRSEITVTKLACEEHWGDWHDKPLRWSVNGPRSECQKFSTKREAMQYATLRSRSSSQFEAIKAYSF